MIIGIEMTPILTVTGTRITQCIMERKISMMSMGTHDSKTLSKQLGIAINDISMCLRKGLGTNTDNTNTHEGKTGSIPMPTV